MKLFAAMVLCVLSFSPAHAGGPPQPIDRLKSPFAQEVYLAAAQIEKQNRSNLVMAYYLPNVDSTANPDGQTVLRYGRWLKEVLASDNPRYGKADGYHVTVLSPWRGSFVLDQLRSTEFLKANQVLLAAMLKGVQKGNLSVFWASRPRDRNGMHAYGIYDTENQELVYIVNTERN